VGASSRQWGKGHEDLTGFCGRFVSQYDGEYSSEARLQLHLHPTTLAAVARLVAYCMIHPYEYDTGQAETFGQMWSRDFEEDKIKGGAA